MVELGVIKAGDHVGRAGTAGREADAEFAGKLGVRDRHERGHFLMPGLDELDLAGPLQRTRHTIDAIAGISVDPADTPGVKPLHDEIADLHAGHSEIEQG